MSSISTVMSLFSLLLVYFTCRASAQHQYHAKERVPVLVNNVGPFHNPAESYKYYSLPFCQPDNEQLNSELEEDVNLNQVLAGDRRREALYKIHFGADNGWMSLCKVILSEEDAHRFISAIKRHFIFEMFVDELSVQGFVGEMEQFQLKDEKHIHNDTHYYLFPHLEFSLARNADNQIVAVNLTTDPTQRVELQHDKQIDVEFTYAVHWSVVDYPGEDRLSLHNRAAADHTSIEIHWLSIINSFVLVLLLTAFLAVILIRVLHKDFARYLDEEGGEESLLVDDSSGEESGWKLIHGDVFRFPQHKALFCAAIGNGSQIFVLTVILLVLALLDSFQASNRGAIYLAAVLFYALTAFCNGYISTRLYLSMQGQQWALQSLLACGLFSMPCFLTFCVVNSIAWYYGSSSALPAASVIVVISLWALVSIPLTIFGSLRAKSTGSHQYDAPCKTNRVEREIPPTVWYRSMPLQLLIAGFLPFSAIYIELHYIFLSVYGHRSYTLYGLLAVAFVMLLIVTSFITIAVTYFQLVAENWRWHWRSFLSAATTGLFVWFYACFYYIYRSQMNGMLQAAFFFGYNAVVSLAFSLMLGTVGWMASQHFVRHIYKQIKVD